MTTRMMEAQVRLSRQSACLGAMVYLMGTERKTAQPELENLQVFLREVKDNLDDVRELIEMDGMDSMDG